MLRINISRKRKDSMVTSVKGSEFAKPGLKILDSTYKKHEFGHTPLSDLKRVVAALGNGLDSLSIPYTVLGSAALGTKIKVPESYEQIRLVTNILEFTVPKETETAVIGSALLSGWVPEDMSKYFSVTFRAETGEKVTLPTVVKAGFMCMQRGSSTLYYEPIFAPAKLYRSSRNGLVIEDIMLEGYGTMLMRKLIRRGDRDIQDMVYVSLADDLSELFDAESMGLWNRRFPNKNDEQVRMCVMPVINRLEGLKESGKVDSLDLVARNLDKLSSMLRSDAEAVPAQDKAPISGA